MQYGLLTFPEPKPHQSHKIIHVDMDAFYASIEIRDNPELTHQPVVIAKHPKLTGGRGIVTTCNYIARKFGIHSAMSAQEAFLKCPQAVFIPPNLSYYKTVSKQIQEIYRSYTDIYETVSLDEAYLDVTDNKKKISSATLLGQRIQTEIYQQTKLTCSIGVSYNKYIAKIASDYQKPNGITVVVPEQAQDFLKSLSIQQFPGVGVKTLPLFLELGILTGQDLFEQELDFLIKYFGKLGYSLYYRVRGVSHHTVNHHRDRKSLGRERTFRQFLDSEGAVHDALDHLIEDLNDRQEINQLHAHTLTLKIRYEDFETITRQIHRADPIVSVEESKKIAYTIWEKHGSLEKNIRLLGVTFSDFDHPNFQNIPLF